MADEKLIESLPASIDAPLIFIDGYQGAQLANGVVRINLIQEVHPADIETGQNRKVVGRLAMAVPTLVLMHEAFGELIEKFKTELAAAEANDGPAKAGKSNAD